MHFCHLHNPSNPRQALMDQERLELQSRLSLLPSEPRGAITRLWHEYEHLPGRYRSLALDGLLLHSCLPQLSQLSSCAQKLLKIDFLKLLPSELGLRILQFLDATSLCHASQVSRHWLTRSNDDVLWHRMCNQHIDKKCAKCGWGLPLMHDHTRKRKTAEGESQVDKRVKLSSGSPGPSKSIAPESSFTECVTPKSFKKRPWKEIYAERLVVERNWRKGSYQVQDFIGHTDAVMCLQFDEMSSRLVTGSFDNTLRVWDTESGNCLAILKGHTRVIRALQFDDCKIVSGSMDSSIRIWNSKTFECIRVLNAHSEGIVCLHFMDKLLASGSVDGTIKVWDLAAGCVFKLSGGHRDWVNCIQILNKSLLVSSSDDATVKFWDLEQRTPIMAFEGHVG